MYKLTSNVVQEMLSGVKPIDYEELQEHFESNGYSVSQLKEVLKELNEELQLHPEHDDIRKMVDMIESILIHGK